MGKHAECNNQCHLLAYSHFEPHKIHFLVVEGGSDESKGLMQDIMCQSMSSVPVPLKNL